MGSCILRRKFTKKFKLEAVRRRESGVSMAEVARGLEVSPNVLHRWLREFRQALGERGAPAGLVPSRKPVRQQRLHGLAQGA